MSKRLDAITGLRASRLSTRQASLGTHAVMSGKIQVGGQGKIKGYQVSMTTPGTHLSKRGLSVPDVKASTKEKALKQMKDNRRYIATALIRERAQRRDARGRFA